MGKAIDRLTALAEGQTGRRKQLTEYLIANLDATDKGRVARAAAKAVRTSSGAQKVAARAAAAPLVLAARQACQSGKDRLKALKDPLPA
jgi:hypothetical protein